MPRTDRTGRDGRLARCRRTSQSPQVAAARGAADDTKSRAFAIGGAVRACDCQSVRVFLLFYLFSSANPSANRSSRGQWDVPDTQHADSLYLHHAKVADPSIHPFMWAGHSSTLESRPGSECHRCNRNRDQYEPKATQSLLNSMECISVSVLTFKLPVPVPVGLFQCASFILFIV